MGKQVHLGFQINNRLKNLNDNYEKCIKKVHEISRRWARYRFLLKGRITIAKTLLLPQFTYVVSVLDPSASKNDTINRMLRIFVNSHSWKKENGSMSLKISTGCPKKSVPCFQSFCQIYDPSGIPSIIYQSLHFSILCQKIKILKSILCMLTDQTALCSESTHCT